MQIKKFRHSCLELTIDNQSIVIDPGGWSTDFIAHSGIIGVIITHEHGDHFDQVQLGGIIAQNPDVKIYAPAGIIEQLNDSRHSHIVAANDHIYCCPFSLDFVGGTHETIHPDYPVPDNVGVIVNDGELYYPGDSFFAPEEYSVKTLAVPASAPWMKMSEAMDFITTLRPQLYFLTHDALLSNEGYELANNWLARAADTVDAKPLNVRSR